MSLCAYSYFPAGSASWYSLSRTYGTNLLKRVNFNLDPECHKLLKTACVLLDVSVSEFCYIAIREHFRKYCLEDDRILKLLVEQEYKEGSKTYCLKNEIKSLKFAESQISWCPRFYWFNRFLWRMAQWYRCIFPLGQGSCRLMQSSPIFSWTH